MSIQYIQYIDIESVDSNIPGLKENIYSFYAIPNDLLTLNKNDRYKVYFEHHLKEPVAKVKTINDTMYYKTGAYEGIYFMGTQEIRIKCNNETGQCYLEVDSFHISGKKITTKYFFRKEYTLNKILKMFKLYATELNPYARYNNIKNDKSFRIITNGTVRLDFTGKKDPFKNFIIQKKTISNLHKYSNLPYNVTRKIGEYIGETPLEPPFMRIKKRNSKGGKRTRKNIKTRK